MVEVGTNADDLGWNQLVRPGNRVAAVKSFIRPFWLPKYAVPPSRTALVN
jgi:hypothetical protein